MNMPQMPGLPALNKSNSDGFVADPSGPLSDDLTGVESSDVLSVPSHDYFAKPEIRSADLDDRTHISMPLVPKKGIEVVATRKGFYNQCRHKEGDEFLVKSFEELGEWMKCKDVQIERKRLAILKDKKAKK